MKSLSLTESVAVDAAAADSFESQLRMSTYLVKKFLVLSDGEILPPGFLELAYELGFSAIFDFCICSTHTEID